MNQLLNARRKTTLVSRSRWLEREGGAVLPHRELGVFKAQKSQREKGSISVSHSKSIAHYPLEVACAYAWNFFSVELR